MLIRNHKTEKAGLFGSKRHISTFCFAAYFLWFTWSVHCIGEYFHAFCVVFFFFIWSNVIAFLLIWGNNNNFLSAARFQSLTHQWATSKMGLQIRIRELNTTSQVLNAEIANRHNLSHYAWMFGKRTCQKYSYSLFLAWLLNCTNQLDVPLEGYSKSQNWTEASISFHDANLKRYKKSAMGYSQIQLPCEKSLLTSNRATRGQWVFYSSWMMLEGKNNGKKKKKRTRVIQTVKSFRQW